MPSKNPRIALTIQPHRYELLSRLSKHQGTSRAAIIMDMMELVFPVLERVCVVLDAAHMAQESSKEGLRKSVAKAEAELLPALYQAVGQLDIFIDEAADTLGVKFDSQTRASDTIHKAMTEAGEPQRMDAGASAGAVRLPTGGPRHVIRGSGSTKRGA